MKLIAELTDGEKVNGQYLVVNASKGTNAMGSQYYNIDLKDSSGQINGKKWEVTPGDEEILVVGNVINVKGEALKYKDSLQLKILSVSLVESSEIDVSRFLKQPPVAKEILVSRFNEYVDSIQNEDCSKIIKNIINRLKDKLYDHPAAVSIHHDYMSGLLMHTITMADIAKFITPIYEANYDLLISGVILHDLGKVIELEGPIVYHYSLEGKLLGHISIMSAMIKDAAKEENVEGEIVTLLQHMILSHHGHQEFGSPVLPSLKEALLLSQIDNLDCKAVALNKALETTKEGEFSQKVHSLDGRMIYKPKL